MGINAAKALQLETEFLCGVEANFEAAKGKQFRGTIWQRSQHDESDSLRAMLASNRIYDREKLKTLPSNRRIALHGFERRFVFGKRRTGVAIASTLSPLSHYASDSDDPPPPIGLGALVDHVRQLVGASNVLHVIGICSPSGFTEEARAAHLDTPHATVVLIEPDGRGGWQTTATGDSVEPRVLKIFDPEGANEKMERVRLAVDERSAELLTGGLSAASLATSTNLPEDVVRAGLRQVAAADPELRISDKAGEVLLFRGASVQRQERKSMNVIDRIKQLFSGEGAEAEKINLLAERRAALAQRRNRIYDDIAKLEKTDADLMAEGKAATSQVPRRRLAAQLAQLRKDIGRQNATAAMLNKQIDIVSTDIHNLTLIQQGHMAELPDTETLTANAVQAEELLESLNADAELVGQLETGIEASLTSDEEQAILREFEGIEEPPSGQVTRAESAAEPASTTQSTPPAADSGVEERPPSAPEQDHRSADAEPS